MAMRNIVKLGDPMLKKHSRTVEKFDDRLAQLIDDMKETMYANDGCGLAAVQVGILKRVVVLDVGDGTQLPAWRCGPGSLVCGKSQGAVTYPRAACMHSRGSKSDGADSGGTP